MAYDIGDVVRFKATFTDIDGTVADPSGVTAQIKDPSGNIATYTYSAGDITKASTGVYYRDVAIDEHGIWRHHWSGSGAVAVVEESSISVRRTKI